MLPSLLRFSKTLKEIRSFFENQSFIEFPNYPLTKEPGFDSSIDPIKLNLLSPQNEDLDAWLFTSPELMIKNFLCQGLMDCFYLGPCFRNREEGDFHSPCFTMLEFYQWNKGYKDLMTIQKNLILHLNPRAQFKSFSMEDVLSKSLGEKIQFKKLNENAWREILLKYCPKVHNPEKLNSFDCFHALVFEKLEPFLEQNFQEDFIFIYDYPDFSSSLSLIDEESKTCQRLELYKGNIELSNTFSECWDSRKLKQRFINSNHGPWEVPYPKAFFESIKGFKSKECAGTALGVERLVMVIFNLATIKEANPLIY